jgi:hypothetical protein
MSSFFLGLKMGKSIPCVIPLDTEMESCKNPVFGAPVATMSDPRVKAIPIDLGCAMGQSAADSFLYEIEERNLESNPPKAKAAVLSRICSHWGELGSISGLGEGMGEDIHRVSFIESNEDPDMVRAATELKVRLCDSFNKLQAGDKNDDRIRMRVMPYMLGCLCNLYVPLPKEPGVWNLTCVSNMRKAITEHVSHCLKLQSSGEGYFKGGCSGNCLV